MILHRDPSDTDVAAAFDTLLRAFGYTVVVRKVEAPKPKPKPKKPKPAKLRTPFNRFDAEPKRDYFARGSHKQALGRVTGIKS